MNPFVGLSNRFQNDESMYDEYKDVQVIENFLNETLKDYPDKTFLIGVGEDGHIHSVIGEYYNYCNIYTDIVIHE